MISLILILLGVFYASPSFAQAAQTATFNLKWQDNSSGQSQEDGFNIERGATATGSFNTIGKVGADVVTYTDSIANDPGGVQQCYRITAYNKAGTSGPSNVACATSPIITPPIITPPIPSGTTVSVTVTTTITTSPQPLPVP